MSSIGTICPHPATFWCHDTHRCEVCHADMFKRKDGSFVWPSQDDPFSWDGERIMKWFFDGKLYLHNQGCGGFEFARQNLVEGRPYGYIWIMQTLDLDLDMCWMLDVRRHDPVDEHRQFLFVASSYGSADTCEWHDMTTKFGDDSLERLTSGLHWFADQVEGWIGT